MILHTIGKLDLDFHFHRYIIERLSLSFNTTSCFCFFNILEINVINEECKYLVFFSPDSRRLMIFSVLYLFMLMPKSCNYIELDSPSYIHISFFRSTNSWFNSLDTHMWASIAIKIVSVQIILWLVIYNLTVDQSAKHSYQE